MAASEFQLIRDYFSACGRRPDVLLGVGDDCALLHPPAGMALALTTDTLVEGVHFFPNADPVGLGHKSLAVSLSDLAAMGAEPAWVTLALTLPDSEPRWLEGFSRGFATLADEFGVLGSIATELGRRRVSIQMVSQKEKRPDGVVPVVMLTHPAREEDFRKAIAAVDACDFALEPTAYIRASLD